MPANEHRRDFARLFQGKGGDWYFTVVAPNGEPISQSEGHRNKQDAIDVIEAHFSDCTIVDIAAFNAEDDGA